MEHLDHIITQNEVMADANKVRLMMEWPSPKTMKELRGFLGLTNYYRRFVRGYICIARPLNDLLKKEALTWNIDAEDAFNKLKQAMSSASILSLPNFTQEFAIETDASEMGIGVVLK